MTRLIGVTGTIGSGKSAVGKILAERGVPVVDTDHIVHDLLSGDQSVIRAVSERFGEAVVEKRSPLTINRKALGKLVFASEPARRDLEAIVHPAVILEMRRRAATYQGKPLVAVLVPLLFEAGVQAEFDEVWTVVADEQSIKQRLASRDGLSLDEAEQRISAQWPQNQKALLANRTIDNSGDLEDTARQVDMLIRQASGG